MAFKTTFTSNTSTTLDWVGGEGVLLASGTFGSGKVTLEQDINGTYVAITDAELTADGGFKFVTSSKQLRLTYSGGTSQNVFTSITALSKS